MCRSDNENFVWDKGQVNNKLNFYKRIQRQRIQTTAHFYHGYFNNALSSFKACLSLVIHL